LKVLGKKYGMWHVTRAIFTVTNLPYNIVFI
jgi:hypothetical protein